MSYKSLWQGRTDAEDGIRGQRWHQVVNCEPDSNRHSAVSLIGYPVDKGVVINKGRPGATDGPAALRRALSALPWTIKGSLADHGDIAPQATLPETQQHYASTLSQLLRKSDSVLALGGGHDIAKGSFFGLQKVSGDDDRIGIINFDAHLDLRLPSPDASSGTPFREISQWCNEQSRPFNYCCLGVSNASNTPALFDYATKSGTVWVDDISFNFSSVTTVLTRFLTDIDSLYVTVCMDAFPASSAPGVSAPAAVGIDAAEVIRVIRWLGDQCKISQTNWALSDIAELNPAYDTDSKTARLAGRLGFELVQAMNQ